MPFFVLVSSQSRLGLVSSHLGLGDNFLFGLVSVSSRWGKISLVSSRSRLGQKICRYYFSVSVSCYNPQDKISRSRSRTKIQPLLLLGLGLVQEIWSRPTLGLRNGWTPSMFVANRWWWLGGGHDILMTRDIKLQVWTMVFHVLALACKGFTRPVSIFQ